MILRPLMTCLSILLLMGTAHAAGPQTGPVIKDFGPVFAAPDGSYNLEKNTRYKVAMDVATTGDFPEDLNRHFESAARFLNMSARNGIDLKNIDFAIIVHGPATKDLLANQGYQKRHAEPNPNTELLKALGEAGVEIYLCAQSAAFMKMSPGEFNPAVTIALSAMSAHVRLQSEGYTLIPF